MIHGNTLGTIVSSGSCALDALASTFLMQQLRLRSISSGSAAPAASARFSAQLPPAAAAAASTTGGKGMEFYTPVFGKYDRKNLGKLMPF